MKTTNVLRIFSPVILLVLFAPMAQCQKHAKVVKELTAVERFGALQVKGNLITGKDGKPAQLYGMSFFWSQWMGKYYNESTVQWLKKDWNCTIIRAAMGIESGGYLAHREAEKKKVTTLIDAAIKEGLYVIVDWHDHHGEQHVNESKTFFAEIAQRYGHLPNVIYELYNEPLNVSWSEVLKPYHQSVIDTIRYYDKDNLIVCGTPTWSQDVDKAAADPIHDPNVAYTLHFYAGTHKQSLRDKATAALDNGIAIMITEYGTTEATGNGPVDEAETKVWFDFMDRYHLTGCNWSVADKNESSAALKPGASVQGDWKDNEVNASGLLVRKKIKSEWLKINKDAK